MPRVLKKIRSWLNRRIHGSTMPWLRRIDMEGPAAVEHVFTHIHAHNVWEGRESLSGAGSDLEQTAEVRARLPGLLADLGIQSLLDIPCGDFHWLSRVDLNVPFYLGADIVEALVRNNQEKYAKESPGRSRRFVKMDLLTASLPQVDLILCRDCLVHFSNDDVSRALARIKGSLSTYVLTTTNPARANEKNIRTGEWRPLNLQAPPFDLPPPRLLISEGCTTRKGRFKDKSLGLWAVADLP